MQIHGLQFLPFQTITADVSIFLQFIKISQQTANPVIPSGLTIHGSHWSPFWVPLRSHGSVKMLGVTFDTGGPQTTQKVATKLRLARACTTMCAQRRLDSAVIAASVSTLTRASYTAQFTPWTVQNLPALDVPLNKLFRWLSGNMTTFPTQLLYLPFFLEKP